jgi:hypothetical protein
MTDYQTDGLALLILMMMLFISIYIKAKRADFVPLCADFVPLCVCC